MVVVVIIETQRPAETLRDPPDTPRLAETRLEPAKTRQKWAKTAQKWAETEQERQTRQTRQTRLKHAILQAIFGFQEPNQGSAPGLAPVVQVENEHRRGLRSSLAPHPTPGASLAKIDMRPR